jgi:glycosyltransferase involved in cell wall biosynthesis
MPDPIEALATVAAVADPHAVVVLTGERTAPMIVAAMDTGVPVGVYIHNVEYREFGGVLLPDPDISYFANSAFTAGRLRSLFGLQAQVLPPLVLPEHYRLDTSREKVLFINPTLPKGVEILFQVAERLPELAFRVFESWTLNPAWRAYCRRRAGGLDNLEWCGPTRDVETLYGAARLLMMPSVWEESYGRSAVEAQCSGIPVVASRRGGLPEAVGEGGVLVDADAPFDVWVDAVHSACTDKAHYARLVERARANAGRVEIGADYIVATLLTTLRARV